MTSKKKYTECYVWIWLPGEVSAVVAGKLTNIDGRVLFAYGQSYLERKNAIPIYDKELPLQKGVQEKNTGTESIPGCIRDSSPDAWGRRVILNKLLGVKGKNSDPAILNEFTYLLESGSDRIGALDFQESPTEYQERSSDNASLEELLQAAEFVENGVPLTKELAIALNHGTSIGGARPKVMIEGDNKKYIAKFSSSTDLYNIIKAEFVAMKMAEICGIEVASVELANANGKDVLLVERFDRKVTQKGWNRKAMVSSLTLLGLDEMTARYASYQDLAEIIRHRFVEPKQALKEMFSRAVFNILSGNTDDHARNHAAFWDGNNLSLTPAYDICPQMRSGGEASQSMMINGADKSSKLVTCLASANHFMLSEDEGREVINLQVQAIKEHWNDVCEQAKLSVVDNKLFKESLFMNKYAFEGYK